MPSHYACPQLCMSSYIGFPAAAAFVQEFTIFKLLGSSVSPDNARRWIRQAGDMWVAKQVQESGLNHNGAILNHLHGMSVAALAKWTFGKAENHEAKAIEREIARRHGVRDCT